MWPIASRSDELHRKACLEQYGSASQSFLKVKELVFDWDAFLKWRIHATTLNRTSSTFDTELTASLIYNMLLLCSLSCFRSFIAYARMGPVWAHVRSKWCLVWKLFQAYTTGCAHAGGLPWVSVLEVCSEHTWFNFARGIVEPMFRAYTTRRVRAKRSPKTVLFRAYTTDFYFFPVFLHASAVWAKRLRFKCLRARNIPGGNSFSKAAPYSIPKQQRGSALCLLTKQGPSQRPRWCNQPWMDSDDFCCHS